jgi:hypothetical protein
MANRCTTLIRIDKRQRSVDLEQQAGDNILFILNLGPYRNINHSSIWVVGEEIFEEAGPPLHRHRVGDCEILFTPIRC